MRAPHCAATCAAKGRARGECGVLLLLAMGALQHGAEIRVGNQPQVSCSHVHAHYEIKNNSDSCVLVRLHRMLEGDLHMANHPASCRVLCSLHATGMDFQERMVFCVLHCLIDGEPTTTHLKNTERVGCFKWGSVGCEAETCTALRVLLYFHA